MRYLLIAFLLLGCNPIKQVLKDKSKLDKVAEVVIKSGYCANDTTILTHSDTIVETIHHSDTTLQIEVLNDTTFITNNIESIITKKIVIHDTIKNYIVDESRVKRIMLDLNDSKNKNFELYKVANTFKLLSLILAGVIILFIIIKLK